MGVGGADIANSLLKEPGREGAVGAPLPAGSQSKVKAICEDKGIPIMGMAFPTSDRAGVEAAKANGTKIVIFYPDSHIFFEACRKIIKDVRG